MILDAEPQIGKTGAIVDFLAIILRNCLKKPIPRPDQSKLNQNIGKAEELSGESVSGESLPGRFLFVDTADNR